MIGSGAGKSKWQILLEGHQLRAPEIQALPCLHCLSLKKALPLLELLLLLLDVGKGKGCCSLGALPSLNSSFLRTKETEVSRNRSGWEEDHTLSL